MIKMHGERERRKYDMFIQMDYPKWTLDAAFHITYQAFNMFVTVQIG
jgi:hypothetical protein